MSIHQSKTDLLRQDHPMIFTFIVIFAILINTSSILAQNAQLYHSPVTHINAGQSLKIDVNVENNSVIPMKGHIFYRISGQYAFMNIEMTIDRFNLTGMIPAFAENDDHIEYFIKVNLPTGKTLTYPPGAPNNAELVLISILSEDEIKDKSSSAVIILSPQQGEDVTDNQVLIALSLMQDVRTMKPENMRITVDKYDLTGKAQISEYMITLIAEGLKEGKHNITLHLIEDGKREKLVGWSFNVKTGKILHPLRKRVKGSINTGYNYEDISSRIREIKYIDGRAYGEFLNVDWAAKAHITNLEKADRQPQNRYLASLRYEILTLRFGDIQPQLSEFSLWGSRTRGTHIAFRTSYFNMDLVLGYLRRDIEGEGYASTDTLINPITGDIIAVNQVTVIERLGMYRRKLIAFRPGFHICRTAIFSLNFLKVKDDIGSIKYGQRPKDNLVLGYDLKMHFDHRRITFNTESAVSFYNKDISGGTMADAKIIEDLIVVNQFFEPLPNDSTILKKGGSKLDIISSLICELNESATAHRTNLTLNYFNHALRLGYRSTGRSFRSLGSSNVMNDVRGFSFQDRFRFLNNRVYLTVGYEKYQDNINNRNEITTDRNIIRANMAYYSPSSFPNINFSIRQHNRMNNGYETDYTLPDSTVETIDNRINNNSTNFNIGIDQPFEFMGLYNTTMLMFSNSVTHDKIKISGLNDINVNSISISIMSRKGRRLDCSSAYRYTNQEAQGGNSNNAYNAVNLNTRYMFIPEKLWGSLGAGINIVNGSIDTLFAVPVDSLKSSVSRSKTIDYNRLQFSISADYNLGQQHKLNLSTYKILYSNNGGIKYWDGHFERSRDAAGYINQNDFITRIKYSYNF
ncbi:MAG: hypothetical protein P9X24_19845 [Candidatus Hatepunaea meridiana]|nr:hypothetical protein [Candidatus Hatepunaea meridiana]